MRSSFPRIIRKQLLPLLLIACSPSLFADTPKILFLAGPKDHGRPGRHEYEKDLRVLASCLENASNLGPVRTEIHVGSAPRDLDVYRDASVIVINSSSDRLESETHPLFPSDPLTNGRGYDEETTAFLKDLNALIEEKKIGVVVFHYANWAENWAARGYYMNWIGGLWVQMVSRNPTDQWSITKMDTPHPTLNGVEPWSYRDEIFCRFHLPNDARRTDLLMGSPEKDRYQIGPQVVSWAYQRDNGGRGFVYGGVDWHENMMIDDYRRFLLNGIAWAAHIEVPENGIDSKTPVIEPVE